MYMKRSKGVKEYGSQGVSSMELSQMHSRRYPFFHPFTFSPFNLPAEHIACR